jgi:alpha-galactosidase
VPQDFFKDVWLPLTVNQRIDLGTMRRAHTFWISDHSQRAALCRYMQARANRFLPGHLLNSSVPTGCDDGDNAFTATTVLSRMLGKLAFDGRIADWTAEQTALMAQWVAQFKSIRHLLVQDFYQLLPQPSTVEDWDALQFVSYQGDEAALFVFSGNQPSRRNIALKRLQPGQRYCVTRMPDGAVQQFSGAQLCAGELSVSLQAAEGALFRIAATP